MSHPPFISFHTGSPYFISCAERLVGQIRHLGGHIIMDTIPDKGYYWKNTLSKPSFILGKLRELQRDLIWIDADTEFLAYNDCMKSWESDLVGASHTGDLHGIKASPLCIKYNERTLELFRVFSQVSNERISSNNVDLDHDLLKFEILPQFVDKISVDLLQCSGQAVDYTDGRFIRNGISRVMNKGPETRLVMTKNESRNTHFLSLTLENFKSHG